MIYMVVCGDETDGVCLQLLLPPQDTAFLLPAVDTAVQQTAPTCMCLEATTQTLMRQVAQRTKTTLCSGSSGGIILPQHPGSRSAQKGTCPRSWLLCQVRTDAAFIFIPLVFK